MWKECGEDAAQCIRLKPKFPKGYHRRAIAFKKQARTLRRRPLLKSSPADLRLLTPRLLPSPAHRPVSAVAPRQGMLKDAVKALVEGLKVAPDDKALQKVRRTPRRGGASGTGGGRWSRRLCPPGGRVASPNLPAFAATGRHDGVSCLMSPGLDGNAVPAVCADTPCRRWRARRRSGWRRTAWSR